VEREWLFEALLKLMDFVLGVGAKKAVSPQCNANLITITRKFFFFFLFFFFYFVKMVAQSNCLFTRAENFVR